MLPSVKSNLIIRSLLKNPKKGGRPPRDKSKNINTSFKLFLSLIKILWEIAPALIFCININSALNKRP